MSYLFPSLTSSSTAGSSRGVLAEVPSTLLVPESDRERSMRPFLFSHEAKSDAPEQLSKRISTVSKIFDASGVVPGMSRKFPDNGIFRFQQSFETAAAVAPSTLVATFTATNFQFSSLDDAASLSAVFDQYRIECVEIWYIPRITETTTIGNTGLFTTVVDYDDSNVLTTLASALAFENQQTSRGVTGHYRKFIPHVAVALYAGAFTSFGNTEAPWIDMSSPSVQHYGVKTAWSVTDSALYVFDTVTRLTVAVRNVR